MNLSETFSTSLADVVGRVRGKGVRLWAQDGNLHYEAPKGALTGEEMERLRGANREHVRFLEHSAGEEIQAKTRESTGAYELAPLAFPQLTHWHLIQRRERRIARDIASATRLQGRLRIDCLRQSLAAVVDRHEALRTTIAMSDGV